MAETGRRPLIGVVAHITLLRGVQMAIGFTGCTAARIVVAGIAVIRGTAVMHPGTTDEGGGGVTVMTVQTSRNMVHVLTTRGVAIVARYTIVGNSGVIKHRTDKGVGVMAHAAILHGLHVTDGFSNGKAGAMT